MVGVAITPDSHHEWRNRASTRYEIVAPGRTNVEIKKPSPARRQIAYWSFFARRQEVTSRLIIIIIIIIIIIT